MIKTFTGLTMAAAMAFTVGGALAQQAGGGPQPQLGNEHAQHPGRHDETADSASARVAWHTERVHAAADYWRSGE